MARKYKYMRKDFEELDLSLRHMNIYLNFVEGRVEATNRMELAANKSLREAVLDASDLRIIHVKSCEGPGDTEGKELDFRYDKKAGKLRIRLQRPVKKGETFFLETLTHCVPSDHILEGIYKDTTPEGAPQQYMSQCEMWGFQRIMPVVDDPRAKCTYRTTIEADAGYTHLISNGNVCRKTNPKGRPVCKEGDRSRKVITYENDIPMSPYLFIAAAGTWDQLTDEVRLPSGRKVRLEYLVPPGRKGDARIPMEITKKSVIWIAETQDYEYEQEVYRTITMNKSDSGGMENVGNTTIITDAALIDEHTLDGLLMYAYKVIVHEFEHNQCGSEVTMETPFDMWLNEAYTVDVERQFSEETFDPGFVRTGQVSSLRGPLLGPLVVEESGVAGRIVREGFNDPDELIDGVTYEKAPEVIRMLRLVIGREAFKKGKTDYFKRYRHGNANTDQFFECFERSSGQDLSQFKKGWLYRIGYPRVSARTSYDESRKEFRITFSQKFRGDPFHIPIEVALVGENGKDIPGTSQVFQLRTREKDLVIKNVGERPAFASLNRDYSFYGTFRQEMELEEMIKQVRSDPNHFNRIEAMNRLTDMQRIRLLKDPGASIDRWWTDLIGEILDDRRLSSSMKANLIGIDELSHDRKYIAWYRERVAAREKLMKEINRAYRDKLVREFRGLDTYSRKPLVEGIEDRMLKAVLLGLIAVDDSADSHRMLEEHFSKATAPTDRVTALAGLNRSSSPKRKGLLKQARKEWKGHLSGYANYLRTVSAGTNEDVWEMIEEERNSPEFDSNQPTYVRALFMPMAFNNKMVWTQKGMQWVADRVIEFSERNTTIATRMLNTFQLVSHMKEDLRKPVKKHLKRVVSECRNPAVVGQARAYLGNK